MKRSTFMMIAAIVQTISGTMLALFPDFAVGQYLHQTSPETTMMIRITGIFLLSFGAINFMASRSENNLALRSILMGSLIYLILTIGLDIYWTMDGMFEPRAWGSITFRLVFVAGYLYYLLKCRQATQAALQTS